MQFPLFAFAAAALMLAGCDGGADPAPTRPIKVTGAVDYQARMAGLSDTSRRLALRRAIQDSGNRCKRVDADVMQGAYKAMDMWLVRCSDTGEWVVFLAGAGDVQVRSCRDIAALGMPACQVAMLESAKD